MKYFVTISRILLGLNFVAPAVLTLVHAPTLGMLIAAELFLLIRGGIGPSCAKLHHANDKRCIFCGGTQRVDPKETTTLETNK